MNLFESKTNQMMYQWAEGLAELVFAEIMLIIRRAASAEQKGTSEQLDVKERFAYISKHGFKIGLYSIEDGELYVKGGTRKYDVDLSLQQQLGIDLDSEYADSLYPDVKFNMMQTRNGALANFMDSRSTSIITVNNSLFVNLYAHIVEKKYSVNFTSSYFREHILYALTHEIVHYLQFVLFKDRAFHSKKGLSKTNQSKEAKYYNKEIEIKAYMLGFLTKLKSTRFDNSWKSIPFPKIIKELKGEYFFKQLLPEHQRKVISILYTIYHNTEK